MNIRFKFPTGPGPKKSDEVSFTMQEVPRVGEKVALPLRDEVGPEFRSQVFVVTEVTWTPGSSHDAEVLLWYQLTFTGKGWSPLRSVKDD